MRKSSMRPPVQVPKIASSIRTSREVARAANVREIVRNRDQGLDVGNVEIDDAAAIGIGIGCFRRPFALGRTMRHEPRGDLVGLDVSRLRTEIDDHVAENEALIHLHSRDQRACKFHAEIRRRILAVELRDAQHDVLGAHARPKPAVQVESDNLRHAKPVVADGEIGGDVGMSHAGCHATERAVGDGVGIGAEDERTRKGVALFRKDDVSDSLTGVKFGDLLFLDPFSGLLSAIPNPAGESAGSDDRRPR